MSLLLKLQNVPSEDLSAASSDQLYVAFDKSVSKMTLLILATGEVMDMSQDQLEMMLALWHGTIFLEDVAILKEADNAGMTWH